MRKSALFVTFCSLLFLAGCNWNDNTRNDDTPMEDVERGVNDVMDETRDAIDDTADMVDPDGQSGENGQGQTNESTIDGNSPNPNVNVPNGSSGPNGENGATAPGAPSVNQEDIIEDRDDRKDNDQIDNR